MNPSAPQAGKRQHIRGFLRYIPGLCGASREPGRWLQMMRLEKPADGMCEEQRVPGTGAAVGPLGCSLTAVSRWGRLAGSEHTAKPTKDFSGPQRQKRGREAPGRAERPVRRGGSSPGLRDASLCCVTPGK